MTKPMKSLFTLLFTAVATILWGQAGPIDFEPSGYGATWTWTTFENASNPPVEMVSNPAPGGINISSTVCKFTALVGGAPWAGFESLHGQGIGLFNLTAANCQIKMMVYKSVISPVGIKFATPAGASTGEILVSNTLINQWEELTFDFSNVLSAPSSTGIDQIIFFPDFAQRADNNICYLDNIKFSNQDGSQNTEPMGPAPTPTYPSNAVISLFSNPYTNVPVDTWQAPWSSAQLTDLQIQGNDTKRYNSMNFVGIETLGANQLNLSGMTHFRIDYWTANMDPFRVKLVDFGQDGQYAGGDDSESELSFQPTPQVWNTLEIPLSQFANLNSLNHFSQLILSGEPVGTGVVYIDNVLFFDESQTGLQDYSKTESRIFPNPSASSIQVQSEQIVLKLKVLNANGQEFICMHPNEEQVVLDISNLAVGCYFVELTHADGQVQMLRLLKD